MILRACMSAFICFILHYSIVLLLLYLLYWVISKETVGNSWANLNAISGHKYQNHSNRVISSEWSQHMQQNWLWLVCKRVSPLYTIDCFADVSTQEACTVTQKLDLDQMSERSIRTLKDTNIIKLTFCCKFWGCSLCMTLFWWFWWYLWPKKAFKKWLRNFRPSPWILPSIAWCEMLRTYVDLHHMVLAMSTSTLRISSMYLSALRSWPCQHQR